MMLDHDELWVIHEVVRQDRGAPAYGQEHDLEFVRRLQSAILETAGETKVTEVSFSRGELLQVTRQVSSLAMQGARPIGREILTKAFTALDGEGTDGELTDVPAAFRGIADTNPDDSPVDYAGTDASAWAE